MHVWIHLPMAKFEVSILWRKRSNSVQNFKNQRVKLCQMLINI